MSKRKLKDEVIILEPYGDTDLLASVFSSRYSGVPPEDTGILLLKLILTFGIEMYSYSIRVFLRVNPGKRSGGWLLALFTTGMMLIYNYEIYSWIAAPILTIISVFYFALLLLFQSWPQDWPMEWFINIKSVPMQVFTMLFFLRAVVQIIGMLFFNRTNPHSEVSRGDSLIFKILPDKSKVEERFIKVYIEPIFVFMVGYILYKFVGEIQLGRFFILAAISLFFQEQYVSIIKKML